MRVLRLELRRNTAWTLLPLLAALLWFASPYGRGLKAPVALWSSRSVALQGSVQVLGPFAAGIAAWMASREARRNMADLLASTARPTWFRHRGVLTATMAWSLGFYLAAGVVLFALTAREATWGGPVWWPVAVGAVGVVAFTAFGFRAGTMLPSRFTAPLLAIGLLLVLQMGLAYHDDHLSWISPATDAVNVNAGVFFTVDPSLAVTQLLFVAGVAAAATALAAFTGASPGWPRAGAAAAIAVGVVAAGTSVALAATGLMREPAGAVIPSLHDAASDQPVSYTSVCDDRGPVPVCVHPAYRSILPAIAADLTPLTSQVAGLPGAPVRVTMAASSGSAEIAGAPPVLYLGQFVNTQGPMTAGEITATVLSVAASELAGLPENTDFKDFARNPAEAAQFAVSVALVRAAGDPDPISQAPAAVQAAASRFAASRASTRRAWLGTHLLALRAGHVTLAELP